MGLVIQVLLVDVQLVLFLALLIMDVEIIPLGLVSESMDEAVVLLVAN
jgi:hypothetical protein